MAKKQEKEQIKKEETLSDEKVEETVEQDAPQEEKDARECAVLLLQAEKERDEAKALVAEMEDRYLRILAEYDNFKKRSVKEKEEIYFASKSDVVKKLLPVFDNLDRAQLSRDGEDYRKGVDMIIAQFSDILSSMEIHQVGAVGEEFDPVFHEAVFREEKEDVPENTITEVLQKGWAIGDKVIRHAMVKVSG